MKSYQRSLESVPFECREHLPEVHVAEEDEKGTSRESLGFDKEVERLHEFIEQAPINPGTADSLIEESEDLLQHPTEDYESIENQLAADRDAREEAKRAYEAAMLLFESTIEDHWSIEDQLAEIRCAYEDTERALEAAKVERILTSLLRSNGRTCQSAPRFRKDRSRSRCKSWSYAVFQNLSRLSPSRPRSHGTRSR